MKFINRTNHNSLGGFAQQNSTWQYNSYIKISLLSATFRWCLNNHNKEMYLSCTAFECNL